MDRRAFLISSGGAAVAAASSGALASEQDAAPVTAPRPDATILRLAMPWPDRPQGPADSVGRLARCITAMTDGRFGFEIAEGTAGDGELWHGSAHDFSAVHPAFAYFAGLPGKAGLAAHDLASWLSVGGGQVLWDDLAASADWVPLLAGHSGEAPPLWSVNPIASVADLSGMSVSVTGLGADVMRALGAEAKSARKDLSAAFATGDIAAAEVGGALASLASGVASEVKFATGDGINCAGTAFALHVRCSTWQRMSQADQAIFAAAAAQEFQHAVAGARAHARIAHDVLVGRFGVTFEDWPAEIADAIDRVAEAAVAHVAGFDALAARIDHSYMAFRGALDGHSRPPRTVPVA